VRWARARRAARRRDGVTPTWRRAVTAAGAGIERLATCVRRWRNGEPQETPESTQDEQDTGTQQEQPLPKVRPGRARRRPGADETEADDVSTPIDAAVEALTVHIGGFEPQNVAELDAFLGKLGELYEAQANALVQVGDRFASDMPIEASVHEHLREMASSLAALTDWAAQAHQIYRLAHAEELARLENQRTNEQFWASPTTSEPAGPRAQPRRGDPSTQGVS
jgi:hypothetical protein